MEDWKDWKVYADTAGEASKTSAGRHENASRIFAEISYNRRGGNSSLDTIDSLTAELEQFHIGTPAKDRDRFGSTASERKGQTVSESTNSSFRPVSSTASSVADLGRQLLQDQRTNPFSVASRNLPPAGETLANHLAGQYEWILEVPSPTSTDAVNSPKSRVRQMLSAGDDGREKILSFGCNLLRKNARSGNKAHDDARSANTYTLLATRIRGEELDAVRRSLALTSETESRFTEIDSESSIVTRSEDGDMHLPQSLAVSHYGKHKEIVEHIVALPSVKSPSRIEDSLEAIDKLEEDIEAMGAVTEGLVSPVLNELAAKNTGLTPSSSTKTNTARAKAADTTASSPKKPVTRPTSLLPPKALAKSSKQPTKSSFELPGEAVARRLKEQREARRSQSVSAEQVAAVAAAYSPSKPHVKSTKPPTRPTFELPGEAISRRKREELEAKLKAQEEGERKRREFKARPIRTGSVASSVPRQTLASLARQSMPSTRDTGTVRRLSMTPASTTRGSLTLSSASSVPSSRGRPSMQGPSSEAEASRAGSSLTVERSAPGTDDVRQQKLRGRDIYKRDNSIAADRQRERRDREVAALQARREAAERSRQSGRDWAEKQRLKKAAGTAAL